VSVPNGPGFVAGAALASAALLFAAFAGCLGGLQPHAEVPSPASSIPTQSDLASLYDFEHDHTDPALHNLEWNFSRVGWNSLSATGVPSGNAGEIDIKGDVAAVHLEGNRSGFALLDVRNPSEPIFRSFTSLEAYRPFEARDVKLDPEAEYAYVALQLSNTSLPASAAAEGGFLVFRIADLEHPVLVAQAREDGRGCHMIRYFESGTTRVVYCASSQGLSIFELESGPLGARTPVKAGDYVPPDLRELQNRTSRALLGSTGVGDALGTAVNVATLVQPHDMTAETDPLTGKAILVAAYETYGIRVLDISQDPTHPVELSVWEGEGAHHYNRVHTALVGKIADRRIAIGITETLSDGPSPFWIVDTTDYAHPRLLYEWQEPGNGTSHGILLTTHNIQLVGTTLLFAHYHAGVWMFNLSNPASPVLTGVYIHRENETETGQPTSYWDVVVHKGFVYTTDMASGLVVLRATPLHPSDESFV
jgi:hypothetical protein